MLTGLKPTLNGRVFSRYLQFHALPQDLKDQVAGLEDHIKTIQNDVFAKHHTLQLKSMRGVRYKLLMDVVYDWVKQNEEMPKATPMDQAVPIAASNDPSEVAPLTSDTNGVPAASAVPVASTIPVTSTNLEDVSLFSEEEEQAKRTADEATTAARVNHAKKLIDALVLKGFITPNKEDKTAAPTLNEVFEFKDSELFVPLATAITGLTIPTTTVWDLVDGAVFAEMLRRKAGLLAPLTHGKDVYVVVNARARSVTLFDSDVAREPMLIYEADLTHVTFDKSHYENGVKIWSENDVELLNTVSVAERDALTAALEAIGVTYMDHFPLPEHPHHSHSHHQKHADSVSTGHTFTVEQVTEAASDAVPLDDTTEVYKTHVPYSMKPTEATTATPTTQETNQTEPMPLDQNHMAEKHETDADVLQAKQFKHDETLASSPTESPHTANHVGAGLAPDQGQKNEKALRFEDDSEPTNKRDSSQRRSSFFGLWTKDHANTDANANENTRINANANANGITNAVEPSRAP